MSLDHPVYATPDLAGTVADLRGRGIDVVPGGPHPGRGTCHHLAGLGGATEGAYVEVIGPDREQEAPGGPRWSGIDALTGPRLVTRAVRVTDVAAALERSRTAGCPCGATLVSLTGVHPDPGPVAGPLAVLEAALATPAGEVVLR